MYQHTCSRCRKPFASTVEVEGPSCRSCIASADWEESIPTQPRVIRPIPLQTLAQLSVGEILLKAA